MGCHGERRAEDPYMTEHHVRVGLGAVACGALVALATAAALGTAIAAAFASGNDLTIEALQLQAPVVAAAAAIVLALGAFVGGRVTAIISRALLRRDGVIAGLVTGSLLGALLLAGGAGLAPVWPVSGAPALLWALAVAQAIALVCGMLGGARGARSEARAVGLRAVHRAGATSADSYEREFFSGDSLPRVQD